MSKSLFNRISFIYKHFSHNDSQLPNATNVKLNLSISCIMLALHGYYVISTKETKNICIAKKYKFVRNGFTEFMIIDKEGKHYNINNSLWYWKWNSLEDWYKIETNKEINVKYYGWRLPIFGLFPNIVQIDNGNQNNQINFSKNNNLVTKNYYYL